jgi:hypothetical protein
MHYCNKFAGIFVLGGCLLLAGCPDKSTPSRLESQSGQSPDAAKPEQKSEGQPTVTESLSQPEANLADVATALILLEKYNGTHEKNASGAVVSINLRLNDILDTATAEDKEAGRMVAETDYNKSVGELFDAINKLVDLEKVTFEGPGIDDYGVLKLTNLKKVKTAHFQNANIATPSLKMMAETMPDLSDLSVNRCMNLDGSSISTIARGMPKLKILDLQSNAFKTFDLRNLPNMPELEQLDLRQCTQLDGEVLKHAAGIKNLKILRLRGSYRDNSIGYLAGHSSLRALLLQDADVTDDFLDSILEIPTLIDLTLFRLLDISNDGLKKLEGSKLQRLMIRENDLVDDEGIAVFKSMPDLNRVILYEVRNITDDGLIAALSDNKKLIGLAFYDMEAITDKLSREIIAVTPTLRTLELRKTGQTDETLKLAAKLPRLDSIIIGDNGNFTDEGLTVLGASKSLKTITIMNVTGITDQGIEAFRAKFPGITVIKRGTGQSE